MVAAYYGPLELFVFYLFSQGGQFYYEGFGVGSFWFAALVLQNIGYYVIAALCLPVGIGHIKLRCWALPLTRLFLCFWLGAGILLIGNGVGLIPALLASGAGAENLLFQLFLVGAASISFLVLLPAAALWWYGRACVCTAFTAAPERPSWPETYPFPLLAVLLLFAAMIAALHVAMFLQAAFPLFGRIQFGRPSAYLIALCVVILGVLMYGIVKLKRWAWWGAIVFVALLAVSSAMTFTRYRFLDLIQMMNLPAYEMAFIGRMTVLHDFRLAGLVVVPLLVALALLIYSKRYLAR